MIITIEQLAEIEKVVGHSCKAGVLAGYAPGEIAIRVWAELPDGQKFSYEGTFSMLDHKNDRWERKLEEFKYLAKRDFDEAFAS